MRLRSRTLAVVALSVGLVAVLSPAVASQEAPPSARTIWDEVQALRERITRSQGTTIAPSQTDDTAAQSESPADGEAELPEISTVPAEPSPTSTIARSPSTTTPTTIAAATPTPTLSPPATAPGTAPAAAASRSTATAQETPGGLHIIANERGRVARSISGVTSDGGSATLRVQKPAGSTVRSAYFFMASTGFLSARLTSPLSIDGQAVVPAHETASGISSFNYWNDVTSLVKSKIDGAPAGSVPLSVVEPQAGATDGSAMVVVFDDPSQSVDKTVSILFGALRPTGDEYQIGLARPISLADSATQLEMSLGISFSYQQNATQQFSTVDVNGQRLTSAAGGEDDGAGHNGALLTVGGEGDSLANPADPLARPTNSRSDDELYDLRPFVGNGDTTIRVQTNNPSLDDNIFLAVFTMNPPVTSVITTGGTAYVAVGDSTTTGFSVPTCDEDRNASPYGCLGQPPATPYPERIAGGNAQFSDDERVGIWGYTIREAVAAADAGRNVEGPWQPQLLAAQEAERLVTVSLGANDMQFSDVWYWLKECLAKQFTSLKSTCQEAAKARAESIRPDTQSMMNRLDQASANGAEVVITLYYNPYNDRKDAGPFSLLSRDCSVMWAMSEIIVGSLNNVLKQEAVKHGFTVVDLRPAFSGHGAGAKDSYVFGSDCDAAAAASALDTDFNLGWPPIKVDTKDTKTEIQKRFDPHPNNKGTTAQANEILKAVA